MSANGLIQAFPGRRQHCEVLESGLICLKTGSTHGAVHGLLLREMQAGWVQGSVEFSLQGRPIPNPAQICARVTAYTNQGINAHFSEYLQTIYLKANFQRKTLVEDTDDFIDICEDFSAMLNRVSEVGEWDESFLQLTFGSTLSIN